MIKIKTNQTKLAKYLGKTKQTITYRKIHHPKDFYLFCVGFAFENEQYGELLKDLDKEQLKQVRDIAVNILDDDDFKNKINEPYEYEN